MSLEELIDDISCGDILVAIANMHSTMSNMHTTRYTCIQALTQALRQAGMQASVHAHAFACAQAITDAPSCMHACTHRYVRMHARAHTRTRCGVIIDGVKPVYGDAVPVVTKIADHISYGNLVALVLKPFSQAGRLGGQTKRRTDACIEG